MDEGNVATGSSTCPERSSEVCYYSDHYPTARLRPGPLRALDVAPPCSPQRFPTWRSKANDGDIFIVRGMRIRARPKISLGVFLAVLRLAASCCGPSVSKRPITRTAQGPTEIWNDQVSQRVTISLRAMSASLPLSLDSDHIANIALGQFGARSRPRSLPPAPATGA